MKNTKVTFTNSQKRLLEDIKDWYNNNKSLSYTISGEAGTGKSFIVKYIIKELFKNKRICVSAPTHKAVRVIEKFTGVKGHTLHSLHGLRPNFALENFNIDKLKFETLGSNKFINFNIIIVDEASMISPDLKKLNDIRSIQYNTKIIYIGDKLQLPPVMNHSIKLSPVFNNEYGTELVDVVRQSLNNPLHKLFELLRYDVEHNTAKFINYIKSHKTNINNNVGYEMVDGIIFSKLVVDAFKSDKYKKDVNSYKLCAYTNDRINSWNRYIRGKLTESKDILVKNDILTGYQTIVDEFISPIIINSNDYIVIDVYKKTSDYKFDMFVATLKDLDTGFIHTVNVVDHNSKTFVNYYNKLYQLHHNALYGDLIKKGELWKMYYNFKHLYLTMIDFELFNNRKQKVAFVKKELDYGYAITTHKAQGSSIDTVFIDSLDIIYYNGNKRSPRTNTNNNPNVIETRNRLLYTGLSRAKSKAIILY